MSPQRREGQLPRAARFSGVSVSLSYFVSARGEFPPSEQFTFNSIQANFLLIGAEEGNYC